MDLVDMNRRLRNLHAHIGTLRTYQGQAWLNSDMVLYYQYDREIRETLEDALKLQREIDGLNSGEVKL